MRLKSDFITNSSSTAFIITNVSDKDLSITDFVRENPQLIEEWNDSYGEYCDRYTQEQLLKSSENIVMNFKPGEEKYCVFGDEDGTLIGKVFDYILREGGRSKNFLWRFEEFQR